MLQRKHVISLTLAVCLLAGLFAGCTGSGQSSSDAPAASENEAASAEQPSESASTEEVTIKFWKYQDEAEQETLVKLVDRFNEENDHIQVELEVFPWEQYTGEKLIASIASGVGPDVYWLSAGDFLKFATNDLLAPINDTFTPELQQDFLPASLKAVSVGENIYGVPHEMGVQSIIYDKVFFEENSITPPTTWDELIAIATEYKTDTRWGMVIPTDPGVFQNYIWYSYLWSAGGDVLDEGWTKARINEPEGIAALELWGNLVKEGIASPKGGAAFDADVAQGKAVMASLGQWVADNFTTNYPDFEFGVAPIPVPEQGMQSSSAYGGWFSVVNAQSPHLAQAKEFAVWLFGQDKQNCLDLMNPPGTYLSPRVSVMDEMISSEYYSQEPHVTYIRDVWPNTRPEPAYPPEIVTAVSDALQQVMFGNVPAEQAANEAADKINTYLGSADGEKIREMIQS